MSDFLPVRFAVEVRTVLGVVALEATLAAFPAVAGLGIGCVVATRPVTCLALDVYPVRGKGGIPESPGQPLSGGVATDAPGIETLIQIPEDIEGLSVGTGSPDIQRLGVTVATGCRTDEC